MDDDTLFRSLTGRATLGEEAAIAAWRAASPQNEARLQQMVRVLALTLDADASRPSPAVPSAEQIVVRAAGGASGVRGPRRRPVRPSPVASWWPAFAAAAVAFVLLGTLAWRWWLRTVPPDLRPHEVVTGRQEAATVMLGDGSVVRLGPGSRLRVMPGKAHEAFLDGHAYFAVAKQKERPLTIRTPAGDVKVVGTRFDLEASGGQLRLTVVEGRVLLSSGGPETTVNAGEQAGIVEGISLPVVPVRMENLRLDWLGNFLAFQDTPLRDVVREIERQYRVRFAIADSSLAAETVTGWFSGWPLERVVDVVCAVTNAQCSTASGVVTIRPKRPAAR